MRSWSIHLFSVLGIRLEVHATFFLIIAVFWGVGWLEGGAPGVYWATVFVLLLFVCVLLHELGHSLAAQAYGIEVIRILLLPIGGMAQFQNMPREARKEMVITLAGPFVNLCLAVPLLTFGGLPREIFASAAEGFPVVDTRTLLQALLIVNLLMGFFNLLPIFPMDGGRLLRAFLTYRFSYLNATRIAVIIAKVLAIAGIATALFASSERIFFLPAVLFAFIFLVGDYEYRIVRRSEMLMNLSIGDFADKAFIVTSPSISVEESLRHFDGEHPSALFLFENGALFGMLTAEQARILREEHFLHSDPVGRHCDRHFSILQAEWPLDIFYDLLSRKRQRVFPVFSGERLTGVLDSGKLHVQLRRRGVTSRQLRSML